ncbi:MAG: 3-deoxy-D-manno-octulosonic acid transferase [Verrucomicrobia bacterium]|nr:3-deoxy-D-manno-octulosonic acid transferase [Verrucomicrobiota bacterium]
MRWLYNILFGVAFWIAAPWLLVKLRRRGAWREAFPQRFGRYQPGALPPPDPGVHRLWLHAVSVGEINTCLQFVRCLQHRLPAARLIVSTTTNTGMAELRKKLPPHVTPIYFPVDQRRHVRRALDAVRPDAVLLVEREIWPNFLWQLEERGIPLMLINARLSDRSHRAYRRCRFLFHKLYQQFALVTAQTEADAARLREVGCRESVLRVVGSLKFDATAMPPATGLNVAELLSRAGRPPGAPVLVAGSTHEGEERLLAGVVRRLRREFPQLFLVLVPRHFERAAEVVEQLQAVGVHPALRSRLASEEPALRTSDACLLVDSTGELMAFYAEADVVFVGKSLTARGGQNPIEPASLGKAMVFGPHMQNFPGITRQFLAADAAVQVADEAGLEAALAELLRSADWRRRVGENAREVVRRNAGATERTADLVVQHLEQAWAGARKSGNAQELMA